MPNSGGNQAEIYQLAHYEIHPEAIEKVTHAIREFVTYIRKNEPGTLRYDVWQDQTHPTRFVHIFIFQDQAAHDCIEQTDCLRFFPGVFFGVG